MKNIILFLFLCVTLFSQETILKIYNFNDYIEPELLKKFSLKYNVKIRYEIYENNIKLYERLKSGNKESYDVVFPSANYLSKMISENLLLPLNKDKLKNFENLDKNTINMAHDPNNRYSVPYFWGTVGIIYDKTKIKNINGWKDFWDPRFKNSLLLGSEPRDVFSVSLKALGYSANSTNPDEIKKAYENLLLLIPNIKMISSDNIPSYFLSNDYFIGMVFNGDANSVIEKRDKYSFLNPAEGSIKWFDSVCIPNGAKNIELAHTFINFLLDEKNSALNAEFVGYALPNIYGKKHLDSSRLNNKIIYPGTTLSKKSEMLIDVKESTKVYDEYWADFLKHYEKAKLLKSWQTK